MGGNGLQGRGGGGVGWGGGLYRVWERTAGYTVKKKTQRGLIAEEVVREAGEKRMMMMWGGM